MAAFFCINLDRRTDRRASFLDAFCTAGLDESRLEFIQAVDARDLTESDLSGFRTDWHTQLPGKLGRLACYTSHCIAIRAALAKDMWPAFIFEDDITFSPRIHEALATLPDDTDIYYLGALLIYNRRRGDLFHDAWASPGPVKLYGGHAYGLPSRAAAEALLTFVCKKPMVFDSRLVQYQKRARAQVFHPFAAIQTFGDSDIDVIKP